jgi:hypothetical protein
MDESKEYSRVLEVLDVPIAHSSMHQRNAFEDQAQTFTASHQMAV